MNTASLSARQFGKITPLQKTHRVRSPVSGSFTARTTLIAAVNAFIHSITLFRHTHAPRCILLLLFFFLAILMTQ